MSSSVEQIKSRIDIATLVGSYMKLDQSGGRLKGKCPFHNEKTPSFFVSPERASYYCFGCGASGDIFTFVEEFEGLDFKGALKLLADRAGVTLETYSKEAKEEKSEKERLYEVMEEATKFFENNLRNSKEAQEYLKSRGITLESIKNFRIGFAILDWRTLYDRLKSKNFTDREIERAGLAKRYTPTQPSPTGIYDRFRGRIMFPISDSSGRIIAFSGRLLVDDEKSAKYMNSPETSIFSKNAVLYGLDKAKESIRKNNFSILVEGQMDLVLSHQSGLRNTIATSGTALSDSTSRTLSGEDLQTKENVVNNLGLIRRLSGNIVLAFDADKAGFNASMRAGKIALSLGMDVKAATLPEGVDPADLISKNGVDAWRQAIKGSKHIIEFMLYRVLRETPQDVRKAGREIKEKILPYVSALESSIEKMHFIKKISDATGIPEKALHDDLKKVDQELQSEKREIEEASETTSKIYRKDYIERRLLGIAFWKGDEKLQKLLGPITEKYKDRESDLIFEAEVFYQDSSDLEKDIQDLLDNLEKEEINETLLRKMQELRMIKDKDNDKDQNQNKEQELLREIQELNKKKHESR